MDGTKDEFLNRIVRLKEKKVPLSEEAKDAEVSGWTYFEERDDIDDWQELADEAFRKSVIAGNKGAFAGVALAKEEHEIKEILKCLRWSAEAGRIDAIENLQDRLGNKPSEMIEKYAWTKVLSFDEMIDVEKLNIKRNEYFQELWSAFEDELEEDELKKVDEFIDRYLTKVEESGFGLGRGMNPY